MTAAAASPAPEVLDGGTDEVVRKRLDAQGAELKTAVDGLDARRRELFGGSQTVLAHTFRVRTEHNCVLRDVCAVGDRILLGYHVHLGLKTAIQVGDVFAELVLGEGDVAPAERTLLVGEAFERDFREIFAYFKDARLLQLRRLGDKVLAAFQTGSKASDVRVLRWAVLRDAAGRESLRYLDNRGDVDHVFPSRHDFAWTRTTREQHVHGAHPHVNIRDTVFVECVGGDLTVKVENNTATGAGILSEPVKDPTQGLDDAEIWYAAVEGFVLLKVRPYRENEWRHLVYNQLAREAVRIDAIGDACQLLPEGHGLVFPGGYYLASGERKVFPVDTAGMVFERVVRAPNGEDIAYVYYLHGVGQYAVLRYSLIRRAVDQPMLVNGHALLDDGRMLAFKAEPEPQRLHAMQVWQTPFCSDLHHAGRPAGDGLLARLGNRELVRAVSDLLNLHRLLAAPRRSREGYVELLKQIQRALDGYHWLGDGEAFALRDRLGALRATAEGALDEFDRVAQLAEQASQHVAQLEAQADAVLKKAAYGAKEGVDAWVAPLAEVRRLRGAVETATGIRHADRARLAKLDQRLEKAAGELSAGAARALQQESALAPYRADILAVEQQAGALAAAVEAKPLGERLDAIAGALDLLVATINGLAIADTNARTALLERLGAVYGELNRARAILDGRRRELGLKEGRAGFGADLKLLAQAAAGALALCSEPATCDEQVARLMLQLEELEGRYAGLDEFTVELATKRAEIADGFAARKQALLDDRRRRADATGTAADRVLESVARRAMACKGLDELNALLAADPMVAKLRALVAELRALEAPVKADDVEGRLKAARDHAARHLRDQGELVGDEGTLRLGRHRFSITGEAIDLAIAPSGERLTLRLTGTRYQEDCDDPALLALRPWWGQDLPSENPTVYRGEWLAWALARAAEENRDGLDGDRLRAAALSPDSLLALVRDWSAERYDEGYERGVHDADGARLLAGLLHLRATCGVLRHTPLARALGLLTWRSVPGDIAERWARQCRSARALRLAYGPAPAEAALDADLARVVQAFLDGAGIAVDPADVAAAGRYLREELGDPEPGFARGPETAELENRCLEHLALTGQRERLLDDLRALADDPAAAWRLAQAWIGRWAALHAPALAHGVPMAAAGLVVGDALPRRTLATRPKLVVDGLLGRHPRIEGGRLELRLDEFEARLSRFAEIDVKGWKAWHVARRQLAERERDRLRVDEFKPKVLTSFVRNRLVDEVYLPLVGDNLAKQIGAAGAGRRTDLMGLLLLVSPPGYGKTTLVEYVASVLGLAFVKVNGPALGHGVTALDPAAAPDAAARQELEKLNLALEMGDNVLLVIDDIQHCNPEFLQKFISLCDGSRRIEGVWRGKPRLHDLRGRRFAVVMAGNPYTESGERFRIPDMLANRADTWNLGDVIGGHRAAFEDSYLQNCLVVNPVLQPVASRPPADFHRLLRIARGDEGARAELEHPYTALELDEIAAVLRRLDTVRGWLVKVNETYIASAATADAYRTEPPFKLQGSYRNMAKIAARVVPALSDQELLALVLDHYRGESQTLTTGAEANLLKLDELLGCLSGERASRWADIKRTYTRRQELAGQEDPAAIAALQIAKIGEQLGDLRGAIAQAAQAQSAGHRDALAALGAQLERLATTLAAARPAEAPPPQQPAKIEVINTLPKYYAQLYQNHIAVIEQGLMPVLEALGGHLQSAQLTRKNMEIIAGDLRKYLAKQTQSEVIDLADEGG